MATTFGRARSALLAATAAALVLTLPSTAAHERRYEIAEIGLSLEVPAGWQQTSQPGWNFVAARPDGEAKVFAQGFREATGFFGFRTLVESYARKTARGDDPHAKLTAHATRIAGRRAVEIVARYGALTSTFYGVVNEKEDYILDFVAATDHLAAARPAFADSLRSVRFSTLP